MTLKELSQLYYLNREIEMDKKRLEELKSNAYSLKGIGYNHISKVSAAENGISKNVAEIVDLEKLINNKVSQCIIERNRLERYIANIPDSLIRQILTLRFINGLTWAQVASHISGNTEDSVKKMAYRYIQKT